jgi:hypothetical protein
MRTLHFHPLFGLLRPQGNSLRLHLPHIIREPWFWAAVVFFSLILTGVLLVIFGEPSSGLTMPYPMYYP